MRIVRAARLDSYDIVPRELVRDTRLSFRAKGIAIRLLSNVDGFSMTSQDLAKQSPREGRDAVLAAMRELIQVGYMRHTKERLPNGQFRTVLMISDRPSFVGPQMPEQPSATSRPKQPEPDKPTPAGPAPAKPEPETPNPASPTSGKPTARAGIAKETTTTAVSLAFPAALCEVERETVVGVLAGLEPATQQQIVDELAGKILSGHAPHSPVSWVKTLARRATIGEFVPDAGLVVRRERERRGEKEREEERRRSEDKKAQSVANLPETLVLLCH